MLIDPSYHFDDLYVISDLHLGGEEGFQIFNQGDLLADFIDHLRQLPGDRRVCLVINGDLVDFLAEPDPRHFDPTGAAGKLDRILADPSFDMILPSLQRFLLTSRRHLAVTLGNHDLELALPWVRERLIERISDGDATARSRLYTVFDGTGFQAKVGGLSVLCTHGNETDILNVNDYERLRRIACQMAFGQSPEAWIPNAGTQLVIDVMSEIKKRYRFVDLLKPELTAAVPVLLALRPEYVTEIGKLIPFGRRVVTDWVRRRIRLLGEDDAESESSLEEEIEVRPLQEILGDAFGKETVEELDEDYLKWVEDQLEAGTDPESLAKDGERALLGRQLRFSDAWKKLDIRERLRRALLYLQKEQDFSLKHQDPMFKRMDRLVGKSVDVVITGHTHKPRSIPRSGGHYFNSGSWIQRIRSGSLALDDKEAFNEVYGDLSEGSQSRLTRYVEQEPVVVSICRAEGAVKGAIQRVGRFPSGLLEPVPDSEM
ncbi:MAG TPA: metallophosphoesterase [Acidobacteriota bacterium]|nr:metallophosphoesterase [Acidobacteriota bacterium]